MAKFEEFVAVKNDGSSNIIGKLLYFTLGRAIINEEKVMQLIRDCGIDESHVSKKFSNTHAFKSATKVLERSGKWVNSKGELEAYNVLILDNAKENHGEKLVREIKLEIKREKKNEMVYLGNFSYDKEVDKENEIKEAKGEVVTDFAMDFSLNPVTISKIDPSFDVKKECTEIVVKYNYWKKCFNENRLVTFVENYLYSELDASDINVHGKLFFIPIYKANELAKLETFMMMIAEENEVVGNINMTSISVMDDEKYIKEYSKEFYAMAEQEMLVYQTKLDDFIRKGKDGKIVTAWVDKIQKFLEKKKNYESTFKRNLENLDDDVAILDRQLRELTIISERKKAD